MKNNSEKLIEKIKKYNAKDCIQLSKNATRLGNNDIIIACELRLEELKTINNNKKLNANIISLKTITIAEHALEELINDYKNNLPPTTYGALATRCNEKPARWFGQVSDLIDAACALNNIPSFALVRVLEANGKINDEAWKNEYAHLREKILARATNAKWNDDDFEKIKNSLSFFKLKKFGNKKAWRHNFKTIDMEKWATG